MKNSEQSRMWTHISGQFALDTEERSTHQEIDDAKRIRKVVENFQADSDAIDTERAAIEELRERLDDPEAEAKATSERYYRDAPQAEMNVTKRKVDLFGNPSLLFEQQHKLQRQINTLFSKRYELISRLRSKDDTPYYAMLNEDRSQRAEGSSAEREAEVGEKRKAPAFPSQLTLPELWSRPPELRSAEREAEVGEKRKVPAFPSGPLDWPSWSEELSSVGLWGADAERARALPSQLSDVGSLDPAIGVFSRARDHRRNRIAQACEKCRVRKARCSGELPTCQRCLERGLECKYAAERRMRGPKKPKPSDQGLAPGLAELRSSERDAEVQMEDQMEDSETLIEYFSGTPTTVTAVSETGEGLEENFVRTKDRGTTITGETSNSSSTDPQPKLRQMSENDSKSCR